MDRATIARSDWLTAYDQRRPRLREISRPALSRSASAQSQWNIHIPNQLTILGGRLSEKAATSPESSFKSLFSLNLAISNSTVWLRRSIRRPEHPPTREPHPQQVLAGQPTFLRSDFSRVPIFFIALTHPFSKEVFSARRGKRPLWVFNVLSLEHTLLRECRAFKSRSQQCREIG